MLAQEIIKVISAKDEPINNFFFYSSLDQRRPGDVVTLPPKWRNHNANTTVRSILIDRCNLKPFIDGTSRYVNSVVSETFIARMLFVLGLVLCIANIWCANIQSFYLPFPPEQPIEVRLQGRSGNPAIAQFFHEVSDHFLGFSSSSIILWWNNLIVRKLISLTFERFYLRMTSNYLKHT